MVKCNFFIPSNQAEEILDCLKQSSMSLNLVPTKALDNTVNICRQLIKGIGVIITISLKITKY